MSLPRHSNIRASIYYEPYDTIAKGFRKWLAEIGFSFIGLFFMSLHLPNMLNTLKQSP